MRIAVISDIHSNLPALTKTLDVIESFSVDAIHCLGDIVGYGAHPNECVELIRERCSTVLCGNHDLGAIGKESLDHFNQYGRSAIRWTRKVLTPANAEYLGTLPFTVTREGITLAHASVPDPEEFRYVVTWPEAHHCFDAFTTPICFIGHTHIPVLVADDGQVNTYRPERRHLMNVGSVGQPRDGNPRSSFALYDEAEKRVEIIRVPYDIEASARAILDARLPDYLAQRLFLGI
jgi:diadenosine tetraphosphatase ApaH/serine/threonine PP2A family protein phosphatase